MTCGFALLCGIVFGSVVQEPAALRIGCNYSLVRKLAENRDFSHPIPRAPTLNYSHAETSAKQTGINSSAGNKSDADIRANASGINFSVRVQNITPQLILTWKGSSMDELPPAVLRNVKKTIAQNPDLKVRWLGDDACLEYLESHYDSEIADYFSHESVGMFRGDICRAAVLAREGGFYVDLDVQLLETLETLVEKDTTFMSVFGANHGGPEVILNALMAAKPGNPIVIESIEQIRHLYRTWQKWPKEDWPLVGPTSLFNALKKFAKQTCSSSQISSEVTPRWECGPEVLRMHKELLLLCSLEGMGAFEASDTSCPPARRQAIQQNGGAGYVIVGADGGIVGWPRFAECREDGCGAGGHQAAELP